MVKKTSKKTDPHPSYPNPTIAEALCEIHFALPDDAPWKASFAGDLFKKIQDDFPVMEPKTEIDFQFELGPQPIGHSLLPPRQRMCYKHKDRPLLLQLGPNVFTVNVLPEYAGWDMMCQDVLGAWQQAKKALKPEKITRIGLRYINRISMTNDEDMPGEWFHASDYLPVAVLRSKGSFLSRVESQIDPENRIIVTFAESRSDNDSQKKDIIFDIDRIRYKTIPLKDKTLLSEMNHLHDHIWEIFKSAQTDRLKAYLERGVSDQH